MPTTTTVNVSTSVVLIDTSQSNAPYYIDFPNISTVGRLITVRDNAGYASLLNGIVLRPIGGATFNTAGNIEIDQPFGFVTLTSADSGRYNILNTFAFPAGQAVANISNLNASNIAVTNTVTASTLTLQDQIFLRDRVNTSVLNSLTSSNNNFYLNYSTILGNITTSNLNSTVNGLGTAGYISTIVPVAPITDQQYVAVGFTQSTLQSNYVAKGTIITGVTGELWADATFGPSQGFTGGGLDVASGNDLFVAVGSGFPTSPGTNYIQYSREGSNWSNATLSLTVNDVKQRVIYGADKYIATGYSNGLVGGTGTIICSPDGVTWTAAATGGFLGGYGTGLSYGLGVYVATGVQSGATLGQSIQWTTNGSNWNGASSTAWNSSSAWDVTFNGTQFIALVGRTPSNQRICLSGNGSNWSETGVTGAVFPIDSNNGGYIAANQNIVIVTSSNNAPSGQMMYYSLNGGYSWQVNASWASGQLSRPYWDGSQWWVGYYNPASPNDSSMYYSANGIAWTNAAQTNFAGGLMRGIALRRGALNFGPLLISTVAGLQSSFNTQTFSANTISAGQIAVSSLTVSSDLSFSTVTIRTLTASTIAMPNINITATNTSAGIAIGNGAGRTSQGTGSIAIGGNAGSTIQGVNNVAIGPNAGSSNQANFSIALGNSAAVASQATFGIAIGSSAGEQSQSTFAIAIGSPAGFSNQGAGAIAIGRNAGRLAQSTTAIAIGSNAGSNAQGTNAIAIGTNAGTTSQHANSIILNALGTVLNSASTNRTYVAPIRQNSFTTESGFVLGYTTANEICQTSTNTISIANGRVGINDTSPSFNLDVAGTAFTQVLTIGPGASAPWYFSTLANNYPICQMNGGNSRGYLFGAFQALSDGISLSYNYYDNNAPSTVIVNAGGGTSHLRLGYSAMNFYTDNAGTFRAPPLRMTLDGVGRFGIGTGSPQFMLDVAGTSNGQLARFKSSIGSQEICVTADLNGTLLNFNSSNNALFQQGVGTGTASALEKDMFEFYAYPPPGSSARRVYQVSTSADVRFNSNVGFGTWPSSSNRVEIIGNLSVRGGFISASNGYFRGVDEPFFIANGSPAYPIAITNTSTGMYVYRPGNNTRDLYFSVMSNTTMITPLVIANNGRVGINTTSPDYSLDVQASTEFVARFRSTIATDGNPQSITIGCDANSINLNLNSSNNARYSHAVGTGAGGGYTKDMYEFYTYPAPSAMPASLVYQVSTSADVRFNSNVGVKTWPISSIALDVNGIIRAQSSILTSNGSLFVAAGPSPPSAAIYRTTRPGTFVYAIQSEGGNFNSGLIQTIYNATSVTYTTNTVAFSQDPNPPLLYASNSATGVNWHIGNSTGVGRTFWYSFTNLSPIASPN